MNSERVVAWATALALGLAFGLLVGRTSAASPPNVLLIISDDQAWTDYGFMGHPHVQTPALDRLARQSLTFTRGYVAAPLCRPSLASIITGLFPHQHGITGNDPELPEPGVNAMAGRANPRYARYYETLMHRIEEHPTLPRWLARRGYVSLQTGKWWEGPARRGGFTEGMTHGDPARGGRHGDAGLTIGREGLRPIFDFIERATAAQKPFFIWYAPLLPHAPHTPPERLLAKYRDQAPTLAVARYWAMCEWFDETCGELLRFLDERKLADQTLVVYVADNGWIQDPERPDHFAPRSKRTPYEGGIRTPVMVRWPGHVAPRLNRETPVSSLDLAPTILHACGIEPPASLPGVNLLDPRALAALPRIFGEAYTHNVADVEHPTRSLEYRWVIEGFWKLILPEPRGKQPPTPELYNLLDDPCEERDLAGDQLERVAGLRASLESGWQRTGGPNMRPVTSGAP